MKDLGNKSVMAMNLKRLMAEKNVSARELSKTLNFPYTTVLSWLKGDNYPRIDKIEIMADYFDVLKSDLIEDKHNQNFVSPEVNEMNTILAKLVLRMRNDDTFLTLVDEISKLNTVQRDSVQQIVDIIKNK